MKIFEILPRLNFGGAEVLTINLCKEFIGKNHEVTLVCFSAPNKKFLDRFKGLKDLKILTLEKKKGIDLKLMVRISQLIKEEKPDIVHTHLHGLDYILFHLIKNRSNTKFYHTIHNIAKKDQENVISRWIRKPFILLGKVTLVAISYEINSSILQTYNKKNAPVIYNGTPLHTHNRVKKSSCIYTSNKKGDLFLNVGRVTHQKNQKLIIEVFSNISDTCLIAGPIENEYLSDYDLKQLPNNVVLLGPINDTHSLFHNTTFFILSSKYEGLPLTLLEAMMHGKICLAPKVGGIPEIIIDGYNGFLFSPNNKLSFIDGINKLKTLKPSVRNNIKTNAIKTIKDKFSMKKCAFDYLSLFSS